MTAKCSMEACSGSSFRGQEGRLWQCTKLSTCKIHPCLEMKVDILINFSLFSQITQNFSNPTGRFFSVFTSVQSDCETSFLLFHLSKVTDSTFTSLSPSFVFLENTNIDSQK